MATEAASAARAHEIFDPVAQRHLELPGIDIGPMFGSEGLRVRGKVYAFVAHDGTLVVKLPRARIDELDDGGGVTRMRMRDREMKEWARVPVDHDDLWAGLMGEARDFLEAITP
jgi:hypothetical protein